MSTPGKAETAQSGQAEQSAADSRSAQEGDEETKNKQLLCWWQNWWRSFDTFST